MKKNIAIQIEESVNVIDSLNHGLRLTPEEKLFFQEHYECVELNKNDFIIKAGEKEKYVYFIEEGILRYWLLDYEEREVTFWFSFEGEFANSYSSLQHNEPSSFNIQALCHTTIWKLELSQISYLYEHSLNANKIARIVLEDAFTRKINREICLLKQSPEERYKDLLRREKYLIHDIPLKYIASYLGITPQTLSRIRKQLLRKDNEIIHE